MTEFNNSSKQAVCSVCRDRNYWLRLFWLLFLWGFCFFIFLNKLPWTSAKNNCLCFFFRIFNHNIKNVSSFVSWSDTFAYFVVFFWIWCDNIKIITIFLQNANLHDRWIEWHHFFIYFNFSQGNQTFQQGGKFWCWNFAFWC